MKSRNRRVTTRALLAIAALSAFAVASAAADDVAGDRVLKNYVLSMDKVAKYDAASKAVMAAMKSDPGVRAEAEKMSEEPQDTLAELEAKFTRHPRLFAFYQKQGLSKDDAVIIPMAVIGACALAQASPADTGDDTTSPAQVAFCRKNLPALKKFAFFAEANGGSGQ
jgi:hypothetical protein